MKYRMSIPQKQKGHEDIDSMSYGWLHEINKIKTTNDNDSSTGCGTAYDASAIFRFFALSLQMTSFSSCLYNLPIFQYPPFSAIPNPSLLSLRLGDFDPLLPRPLRSLSRKQPWCLYPPQRPLQYRALADASSLSLPSV